MTVPDQISSAFTGTRGKVLIAGGIGMAAYLWWSRGRTARTSPADPSAEDPYSGTGGGGPAHTGVPLTTNPGTTTVGSGITDNAQWLAAGTTWLIGQGADAASAFTALSLALAGQPLTDAQYHQVSLVLAAKGVPPDGMPPLAHSAPTFSDSTIHPPRTGTIGGALITSPDPMTTSDRPAPTTTLTRY
jgi:hypothetical protein